MPDGSGDSFWTKAEDEVLTAAVQKYGTYQWDRIASLFSRKSAKQVKERWHRWVSPAVHHHEWFPDEDRKLLRLSHELPNQWASISLALPGRTAEQCYSRFLSLTGTTSLDALQQEAKEGGGEEDAELVAEATARFANTLGRKGKRKLREKNEAEERHIRDIESHRQGKKTKLAPTIDEAESVLQREAEILARSNNAQSLEPKLRTRSTKEPFSEIPSRYVKRRQINLQPQKVYRKPSPEQIQRIRSKLEKLPRPVSVAIELPDVPRSRKITEKLETWIPSPEMLGEAKALVDAELEQHNVEQRDVKGEVRYLRNIVQRDFQALFATFKRNLMKTAAGV